MARKLTILLLVVLSSAAAAAATVSVAMPALTLGDFVAAWPNTEPFTDGFAERALAYPSALHGRAAARRDIAAGRLAFKFWGSPALWRSSYARLLGIRGVDSKVVSGCVVSQPRLAAWHGYNDVMVAEVERRYGAAFLQAIAKEAKAEDERVGRR